MKPIVALTLGLTVLASSAAVMAGPCANKISALETELSYAQSYGNHHRVADLQSALSNTRAYCNDANIVSEKQYKADKQRLKIKKVEAEIQQLQAEGRIDKAQKKRLKLEREKLELQQIINETPGVK